MPPDDAMCQMPRHDLSLTRGATHFALQGGLSPERDASGLASPFARTQVVARAMPHVRRA
jgi:hypothetical protein